MYYNVTAQSGTSYAHLWDIETARQHEGGFLLTGVPDGLDIVPRGTLVTVDTVNRTANVIHSAKVVEAVTASATSVKISKSSLISKGDVVGIGGKYVTVGAITSGDEYNSFAITAGALGTIEAGDALITYANGAAVKVGGFLSHDTENDANPVASVTFAAVGIHESEMPYGVGTDAKAQLNLCQFV